MTPTPSFAHHLFTPWHAQADRRIVARESHWREPLAWNLAAACDCPKKLNLDMPWHLPGCPQEYRPRVLVGCEVFEEWNSPLYDPDRPYSSKPLSKASVRQRLFDLIAETPHLDWLIATEKPENVSRMMPECQLQKMVRENSNRIMRKFDLEGAPPQAPFNVWLGVFVSTQAEADARIPALLKVPAAVRWVWCWGMTEEIDFRPKAPDTYSLLGKYYSTIDGTQFDPRDDRVWNCFPKIDWLAISSPTGPDAHPTDLAHVRSVVKQFEGAGVPVWAEDLAARSVISGLEVDTRQLPELGR
jgi:hypothetical protein